MKPDDWPWPCLPCFGRPKWDTKIVSLEGKVLYPKPLSKEQLAYYAGMQNMSPLQWQNVGMQNSHGGLAAAIGATIAAGASGV